MVAALMPTKPPAKIAKAHFPRLRIRQFALCSAMVALFAGASPMASARAEDKKETPVAPIGNPASWFNNDDYPPEARRNNQSGRVGISLSVDPTGKVVDCDVLSSSGFPLLDTGTCEVALRNARFTPARNAAGQAIAGTFVLAGVRWQIYDEPLDLSAGRKFLFRWVIESRVDSSGTVTSCKVVESGGVTNDLCEGRVGSKVSQPLIKNGKPISGTVTLTMNETIDPD